MNTLSQIRPEMYRREQCPEQVRCERTMKLLDWLTWCLCALLCLMGSAAAGWFFAKAFFSLWEGPGL